MFCAIVSDDLLFFFFFLMIRRPPRSTRTDTLFPYTTLFRSFTFRHPDRRKSSRLLAPELRAVIVQPAAVRIDLRLEGVRDLAPITAFPEIIPDRIMRASHQLPPSLIQPVLSVLLLLGGARLSLARSEERRLGTEVVRTCSSRRAPDPS